MLQPNALQINTRTNSNAIKLTVLLIVLKANKTKDKNHRNSQKCVILNLQNYYEKLLVSFSFITLILLMLNGYISKYDLNHLIQYQTS